MSRPSLVHSVKCSQLEKPPVDLQSKQNSSFMRFKGRMQRNLDVVKKFKNSAFMCWPYCASQAATHEDGEHIYNRRLSDDLGRIRST